MLLRALACLAAALPFLASPGAAEAQGGSVPIATGARYESIGRWDLDRLNRVLTQEAPQFFGAAIHLPPAGNTVRLYRVAYPSTIPERGMRPTVATGLLAVPDTGAAAYPILSYQHGTVYGKDEVPSEPDRSPETALALAAFAAQGYVVVAADYFGLGGSDEPEGYLVKESHQQAAWDMLQAGRAALTDMGIEPGPLFLGGWSQGGFVTMAFLERLESIGEPVAAAATASAPLDGFLALSGFLSFPRPNDASWATTIFILTAFSFESYYGLPGLARSLIAEVHYDAARRLYAREPVEPAEIPTELAALIRPEYFDPGFFAASAYGRLLEERTTAYRWAVASPVRTYYGEADEAVATGLGRLAMTWQQAMGAGNPRVEAISTGATDHRATYAAALPHWKAWFDVLRSAP